MNRKKMMGFAVAGLAAGMLTVTVASTQADESREAERVTPRCLDGRHVGRTHVVDQNTLLVYDSWGKPYKLDVGGPCRSMNDMSVFGFEFNGGSQICRARDAVLLRQEPPSSLPPARCLINGFEPITRAEAAELDKD